jgi:MFS family permease
MTATLERHDPYVSLRIPNYRRFIVSVLTISAAAQIQEVVVGWQIYAHTHDPLSLGLVGLVEAVPFIAVALFAGHLADRVDRRRASLAATALLVLCSIGFVALTGIPGVLRGGQVWPLYIVLFVVGIGRSLLQPARTALGADLVPREHYANAVTWRSSVWQFAAVAGPAVGGLLYGFASAIAAYAVALVLAVIAWWCLLRINAAPRPVTQQGVPVLRSLAEGIRFVRHEPVLLGALTLDLFSVLFGGAVALLPIFAGSILHVGPQGLGVLRAAPAVGAVIMSLALAHRRPMTRAGHALLISVGIFGLAMIGFGLSRSFMLSLGLLALSGMVDNVSVVIRSTLLQVLTPGEMLGRVAAVNAIFIGSSNEVGGFESGLTARLLGTVTSVVLGGAATVGVVLLTAWKMPKLRRLGALR